MQNVWLLTLVQKTVTTEPHLECLYLLFFYLQVLACTECEKFSRISPATELLLDFVHEKKLSSQKDTSQQNCQQKGQRTILVFTEQELFEMLTVSYPLYTQDWLARDHGLNLSRYPE